MVYSDIGYFTSNDDFAVGIRYPDDYLMPTLKETKEYLKIVEEVRKLVLNKMEL